MMLTTYQCNLIAKSLVLLELQERGRVSGKDLVSGLGRRCSLLTVRRPGFRFVHWAHTPIWGLLDNFLECGYLTCSSPSRMDDHEWCAAQIEITQRGVDFLRAAEQELGPAYGLIGTTDDDPGDRDDHAGQRP